MPRRTSSNSRRLSPTKAKRPAAKKRVAKKPARKPARVAKKPAKKKAAKKSSTKRPDRSKGETWGGVRPNSKRLHTPEAQMLAEDLDDTPRAQRPDPTLSAHHVYGRRSTEEVAAALDHQQYLPGRRVPSLEIAASHLIDEVLPALNIKLEGVGTEYTVREAIARQLTVDKRKEVYLEMYREFGNHKVAGHFAGLSRPMIRKWTKQDPEFKQAIEDAWYDAIDAAEAEAYRRAIDGTVATTITEKSTPDGEERTVKQTREYSDNLLQFILRGGKPERYRERHEISGPEGGPIEIAKVEWEVVQPRKADGSDT